jgi:uncharacterized delta-60 repeat protein
LQLLGLEDRTVPAGLDPTFGSGGVVRFDLGGNDLLTTTTVEPDGKIVSYGLRSTPDQPMNGVLTRLNADGTPDTTFGTNGSVVTVDPALVSGPAICVHPNAGLARLADGKYLVAAVITDSLAGPTQTVTGAGGVGIADYTPTKFVTKIHLARYNTDGSLDTTFGTNGQTVLTDAGAGLSFQSVVALSDGSIVLAGREAVDTQPPSVIPPPDYRVPVAKVTLLKITPAGSLDTNFGTNGKFTFDPGEGDTTTVRVEAANDGNVLVFGQLVGTDEAPYGDTTYLPTTKSFVARVTGAGKLDASYGTNGVVTLSGVSPNDTLSLSDGVVLADGAFLGVANEAERNAGIGAVAGNAFVFKLTANGTPDSSFGTNGRAALNQFGTTNYVPGPTQYELVARTNGGVYAVGYNYLDFTVEALTANGSRDTSYGDNGSILLQTQTNPAVVTTVITANTDQQDRLLVSGWSNTPGTSAADPATNDFWYARISPDAPTAPLPTQPPTFPLPPIDNPIPPFPIFPAPPIPQPNPPSAKSRSTPM